MTPADISFSAQLPEVEDEDIPKEAEQPMAWELIRQKWPRMGPRQAQVLALIGFAKSNKEIAYRLNMCESTVRVHVRALFDRFGTINRTQLALIVASQGLPTYPSATEE